MNKVRQHRSSTNRRVQQVVAGEEGFEPSTFWSRVTAFTSSLDSNSTSAP